MPAPRRAGGAGGVDVQVNADDPPGSIQSETTIAACDGDLVASWNDVVPFIIGDESITGFGYSTNGGSSWIDRGAIPNPPTGATSGDPVLAADSACTFYLALLVFDFDTGEIYIGVSKSNNGGQTFGAPVRAGGPTAFGFQDKPWIAADATGGPHDGNIYLCWGEITEESVVPSFARSINGGASFQPAQALASPERAGTLCQTAVGPQGEVYVAWVDFFLFPLTIRLRRSDDGGATFGPERVVAVAQPPGHLAWCGPEKIWPVMQGNIRNHVFPSLAVDPGSGHVYLAWNDGRLDAGDILLTRSTDRGEHWSAPLQVNDDSTNTDQFMPAVAVNPDGVMQAMWYDRRLDPANMSIDVFSSMSLDGGTTFEPNQRMTDTSFGVPPNLDSPSITAGCYMGDYNGLVGTTAAFHLAWGDNRNLDAAGFPQPDVFSDVKAAPPPPLPTPTPLPITPTPTPTPTPSVGLAHDLAATALNVPAEAAVDVSVGTVSIPVSLTVQNQGNHAEGSPDVLADGVISLLALLGLPQGCLPRYYYAFAVVEAAASDLGPGESATPIDLPIEVTCDKTVATGDYSLTWIGKAASYEHGDVLTLGDDADPTDNLLVASQTLHVANPGDSDSDGCTNDQELGPNQALGGLRHPKYFWDFMDVPSGVPPQRDRRVSIADIGGVVARFGSFRQPPPTKEDALDEALSPPPPAPAYHTAYDRGGPIPDQNVWNQLPPNGSINVGDIGAAVVQFGHTCA